MSEFQVRSLLDVDRHVFEPFDLLAQSVTFAAVTLTLAFGLLTFTAQMLVLLLPSFQFGDQLLARCCAPGRSHAHVMPFCKSQSGSGSGDRCVFSNVRSAILSAH